MLLFLAILYRHCLDKLRRRRGALIAAFFVGVIAALALYALLPGEGVPRQAAGAVYDEGGFSYTGTLRGGKFSGQGRLDFAGGGRYEGSFAAGRFEGQGAFTSADGWVFEGRFSEGKPVRGVLHMEDGDIEADAESGIYAVKDGWRYMGLLGTKGPRGQGEFIFADGAVYRGEFLNGKPHGQGGYTDASGTVVYTGWWHDGKFEGEGEYQAPDGSFSYKGSFRAGKFSGPGTLTKADGTVLSGAWKAGWRTEP